MSRREVLTNLKFKKNGETLHVGTRKPSSNSMDVDNNKKKKDSLFLGPDPEDVEMNDFSSSHPWEMEVNYIDIPPFSGVEDPFPDQPSLPPTPITPNTPVISLPLAPKFIYNGLLNTPRSRPAQETGVNDNSARTRDPCLTSRRASIAGPSTSGPAVYTSSETSLPDEFGPHAQSSQGKKGSKRPRSSTSARADTVIDEMKIMYWDDSNNAVTIQVENSRFRISKQWLVVYSKWCKSFFQRENPECYQHPTHGTVYVFTKSEVTAKEVKALLYAKDMGLMLMNGDLHYEVLMSLMRAAIKLRMEKFYAFGRRRLQTWCAPGWMNSVSIKPLPYAREMLYFSKVLKLPTFIKKRAMYELIRRSGFQCLSDGSDDKRLQKHTSWSELEVEDWKILARTAHYLQNRWFRDAPMPFSKFKAIVLQCKSNSPTCVTSVQQGTAELDQKLFLGLDPGKYNNDPICGIMMLNNHKWDEGELCTECHAAWKELWKSYAEDIWSKLDGELGLLSPDSPSYVSEINWDILW